MPAAHGKNLVDTYRASPWVPSARLDGLALNLDKTLLCAISGPVVPVDLQQDSWGSPSGHSIDGAMRSGMFEKRSRH
jgi:hypothetical protein